MTILQALDRYYDRLAERGEAEAPGYSREKIGFAILLAGDGTPVDVSDLRVASGKRVVSTQLEVPAPVKRTVAIAPNLLWDKSAYVLGCTAGEGRRTALEHAAFKERHLQLLAKNDDPGLAALRLFLEAWTPERFDTPPFTPEMLDANIVFRLDGERRYIHDREAARRLVAANSGSDQRKAICLVTGTHAPVQRLHPSIKGVEGAQSSGAALVSFNLDAFTSYGKQQGDNAPISEAAAFRYGAALNRMLVRDSRNRVQRRVGDATVAFWAETSDAVREAAAAAAEERFIDMFQPDTGGDAAAEPADDASEAVKLDDVLKVFAEGRPVKDADPRLEEGTRFHVLGLAPNAARLSVRYWVSDDFSAFAHRLAWHYGDLHIEPLPWRTPPSIQRLLVRTTALQEKFDNIPELLAGEVTRAVLTGARYPRTLLATAIMRLRAGDDAGSGWHAAVIKACINRSLRDGADPKKASAAARRRRGKELPVALEPERENDAAYHLGRLFAVLEAAQYAALGRVNAPIGDRYYGAASSTPARVFGALLRGLKNHVSDARKRNRGGWIEPRVGQIIAQLPAELPRTLKLEDQGRFAVGYYHEKATRQVKAETDKAETDTAAEGGSNDE